MPGRTSDAVAFTFCNYQIILTKIQKKRNSIISWTGKYFCKYFFYLHTIYFWTQIGQHVYATVNGKFVVLITQPVKDALDWPEKIQVPCLWLSLRLSNFLRQKALKNVTPLSEIYFVVHFQQHPGMFNFNVMPGVPEKTEKNKWNKNNKGSTVDHKMTGQTAVDKKGLTCL